MDFRAKVAITVLRLLGNATVWFAIGGFIGVMYGKRIGYSDGMNVMFEMVQQLRSIENPPRFKGGQI